MVSKVVDLKQPGEKLARLEKSFFGEPERESDAFELDRLVKILRRYKYALLLFAALGAGIGIPVCPGRNTSLPGEQQGGRGA